MRPSRSAELADAIVGLITEQNLAPGAPLPTEAQLTADLQTSRGPLREAIKALQAQGIVEVRHGYGTFVAPASAEALLPWLTFRARSVDTLADLLDVRELLEAGLARRVTPSPDTVAELRACVATMAAGAPDSADADRRFHQILCEAAGNALAKDLIGVFWRAYANAEPSIGERSETAAALAQRHERIIDALLTGDGAAVEDAVRRHFDEVRERLARSQ
ncbi:FadR/GntR family transcriptional regulator [Cryptosporangium phraense]|uniref:FadR family transcriptional regulator n=1 Tax=Cryptosporangium phraense TaxID=2593070 RepID=A0A545AH30_9ACTN|nr:FCD domain-containing protein [Cryptosporangium phraense]TQS40632.1 FadR family transcriptional regulator [Cryptosporangium phraense]